MKYDLCRAGILNVTPDKLSSSAITWANGINAEVNDFHAASLKSSWTLSTGKPVHKGNDLVAWETAASGISVLGRGTVKSTVVSSKIGNGSNVYNNIRDSQLHAQECLPFSLQMRLRVLSQSADMEISSHDTLQNYVFSQALLLV